MPFKVSPDYYFYEKSSSLVRIERGKKRGKGRNAIKSVYIRPIESSHLCDIVDNLVRLGPLDIGRIVAGFLVEISS